MLLAAGFVLSVDASILDVALPTVGAGVGLGLAELPWMTAAVAGRTGQVLTVDAPAPHACRP